ncbi:hypothetical protein D5018_08870 [Parashewanella curva]|uniref:Tetratricopeptide repeat protein n=2 Tax=Parashewanella curva TaxID=2338552 RepID=A0A3L8PZQ4_9GAMM|nr:hypothetical protein D5018_08870 [Parashewanella curva]
MKVNSLNTNTATNSILSSRSRALVAHLFLISILLMAPELAFADPISSERKKVSSILIAGIKEILLNSPLEKTGNGIEPLKLGEDSLKKEALIQIKTLKSLTYRQEKNSELLRLTQKYIKLGRYDLAVIFSQEITYRHQKNSLSTQIAQASITSGDFDTAQKAIDAITFTSDKNQLTQALLKRVGSK